VKDKTASSEFNGMYPLVHIPAEILVEKLPNLLGVNVSPEIGVHSYNMDSLGEKGFDKIAEKLHEHGMTCTVHAPFRDLVPGARDEVIREATMKRLREALHLTRNFPKKQMVFHHAYWEFAHGEVYDAWLQSSLKTWGEVVNEAAKQNFVVAFENVFEKNPDVLCRLMREFDSDMVGVCFDPGHFNLFSEISLTAWLDAIKPHIIEMHVHDNSGKRDQHKGIGEGNIDFDTIFCWLSMNNVSPVCVLEVHKPSEILMSIEKLRSFIKKFPNLGKT